MRRKTPAIAAAVAASVLAAAGSARAVSGYLDSFERAYPAAAGSRIAACDLCHTASLPNRNPYGAAWRSAGRSFTTVEGADSDGDGYANVDEIAALTFPGNPADHPVQGGDTTPPTMDAFDLPAESASLTVTILAFGGSDNVAVTGFRLTQDAATPPPTGAGWTVDPPAAYTFAASGPQTLYAWVRDAAGNVSTSLSDTVLITAPPAPTGTLLYSDFSGASIDGDPDWERTLGRFGGVQGAFLVLDAARNVALADAGIPGLSPFAGGRIEARVRFLNPTPRTRAEVLFDYLDAQNYRFVRLDRSTGRLVIGQVGTVGGAVGSTVSVGLPRLFSRLDRWHRLTIDVDPFAGMVQVSVNGATTPVLAKSYAQTGVGRVGVAAAFARGKVAFDNVRISDTSVLP